MSFGWLGTFRSGSWLELRKFVLHERRDIDKRIAYIEAELKRIGTVTVIFARTIDGDETTVTEERWGLDVSQGSSLEKLFRAYVAQGGNPLDVSLFLSPNSTMLLDPESDVETPIQPYDGVVYPQSDDYVSGQEYKGGYQSIKKYVPGRVGGRKELNDGRTAELVARARGWANKEIETKRNNIEAQIIKLADLKEQLELELIDLTMAAAGSISAIPSLDEEQLSESHTVASIVTAIDAVFYAADATGTPDFVTPTYNMEKLENHMNLLTDDEGGEEKNTAL